jgi:hypothetical protein
MYSTSPTGGTHSPVFEVVGITLAEGGDDLDGLLLQLVGPGAHSADQSDQNNLKTIFQKI